ncbi:MAG: N-methyl-L-tryptophan oxidase [Candidatus Eremiobacteraeota bacterium]|nr:N-methyl-L-tryptophan oxidase [Candidatus Eremiobacteraeota bacterium]
MGHRGAQGLSECECQSPPARERQAVVHDRYDAIVLGLGGMGSAAAAHIALRGKRVLGLEQFTPAHDRGSSHGASRIIRQAYFEDPAYVPLLLRAYELWQELERTSDEPLYLRTGGLMVGRMDSALVQGSLRSAREHGLEHELLSATDIARRFPATAPRDNEVAVYEKPAGILFPEACVRAYLKAAGAVGADLRFETPVQKWQASDNGVDVTLTSGERVTGNSLVVCAGAWLPQMAAELALPLRVERNVVHWFQPRSNPELFTPDKLPVYILDRGQRFMLYGFPDVEFAGIKAAFHHSEIFASPEEMKRTVAPDEVDAVRDALAQWLPRGAGQHLASSVCMYTLTPDLHFVIGKHPAHANVIIAGGFSGHGFKFCSVVGETIADLVVEGESFNTIELFSPTRFGALI